MKALLLLLLLGLAAASDLSDLAQLKAILDKPRLPERQKPVEVLTFERTMLQMMSQKKSRPVFGFSWSDCGTSGAKIKISSLSVAPDPIALPGQVTVSGAVVLSDDIGNATKVSASVELEKKVVIWISVPCIHNVGSCDYDDVCSLIPFKKSCPSIFKRMGIPCKCPFAKDKYQIPQTSFQVNYSEVPSGDYRVTVKLQSSGEEIGCFSAEFTIQ